MLSVVFGVGTCVTVYFIGKQYVDENLGLLSGVLTSISWWQFWASRETRSFIVVCFFISVSTYFFIKILSEDRNIKTWIGYIIFTSLATYTFYYAFIVIFAQNLSILAKLIKRKIKLTHWLLSQIIIAALFAPWVPTFLKQSGLVESGTAYKQSNYTALTVLHDFFKKLGTIDYISVRLLLSRLGIHFNYEWYIVPFLIMVVLSTLYFRRSTNAKKAGIFIFPLLLVICILTINILFYTGLSHEADRYFSIFVPFFSIITAGAILFFRKKVVVLILLVPIMLINGYGIASKRALYLEQWREAVSFVESDLTSNDCVIIIADFTATSYDYYSTKKVDQYSISRDIEAIDPKIAQSILKHDRVWLVLSHIKRGRHYGKAVEVLKLWLQQNHFAFLRGEDFIAVSTVLLLNTEKMNIGNQRIPARLSNQQTN